ncbi:MAG: helix-turn-helix transcriptional regulator [Fibrobacteres bacterium]|nr:helix-turn-helix transcriptional regulator [Fibrobacterota bacterium]
MDINDLIGVKVLHARARTSYRSAYSKGDDKQKNSIMIHYIMNGAVDITLRSGSFRAEKGTMALWESSALKEYRPLPGSLSYLVISISPYSESGYLSSIDLSLPQLKKFKSGHKAICLMQKIIKTHASSTPFRMQKCSIEAIKFLTHIAPGKYDSKILPSLPGQEPTENRVARAMDYINRNPADNMNLVKLSEMCGLHKVHFIRLFKKITGLTPHQYTLDKKIEKAKDFLTLYRKSISTTALDLGFYDYAHFYREFKKRTGMSPGIYLRSTRN